MNEKIRAKTIWAVIAVGILAFAGVLTKTATNVAFPAIMDSFRINLSSVQWLTTAYMLTATLVIPLSAYLQPSFSDRRLFLAGSGFFLAGTLLISWSPWFSLIIVGRVIQGIGNGIAIPLMFNIILEQVPKFYLGMMMGVGTLITATAGALGPSYGGVIVKLWGWRMIFIVLIPLLLLSLVIGLATIKGPERHPQSQFDLLSYCWLIVGLVGIILGQNSLKTGNWALIVSEYLLGIIGLALFVRRSLHSDSPILNMLVFKHHRFNWLALSYFMTFFVFLSMSFVTPNYVQLVDHRDSLIAGLVVLPGAVMAAILAPVSGHILDHYGARRPVLCGASLMLVGLVLLAMLALHLSAIWFSLIYLLMMTGMGLCASNIMTTAIDALGKNLKTDGNAILNTLQQLAGAMGTSLSALIISLGSEQSGMSQTLATAHGMRHVFVLFCLMLVVEITILWHQLHQDRTVSQ